MTYHLNSAQLKENKCCKKMTNQKQSKISKNIKDRKIENRKMQEKRPYK